MSMLETKVRFMAEHGNIERERCIEIGRAAGYATQEYMEGTDMEKFASAMLKCCTDDEDEAAFYRCAVEMVLGDRWGMNQANRAVIVTTLNAVYCGQGEFTKNAPTVGTVPGGEAEPRKTGGCISLIIGLIATTAAMTLLKFIWDWTFAAG